MFAFQCCLLALLGVAPSVAFVEGRERRVRLPAGTASSSQATSSFLGTPQSHEAETHRSGIQHEYPFYHTSDELRAEAKSLVDSCNGAGSFWSVNESGVSIDVVRVRAKTATPVNKVFIMFGEHSRELISPESGLALLRMLCGSDTSLASLVAQTLKDSEFEIVLNGNPNSRRKVEQGEYCIRTNPDGVDLNRNWDEEWKKGSEGFGFESNPGPKPFSEPETRLFRQLVTDYLPTTFLTVHSGTRGLYMPWAYDTEHLATRNQKSMMQVIRQLDAKHCQCPYGAAGKEVGYSCPGTSIDYVYDRLNASFAFAFEIYVDPGEDASLKKRWDEKVASGEAALLQDGRAQLAHQTFSSLFKEHQSDFVQSRERDASSQAALRESSCFAQYNPMTEDLYKSTVGNWAEAYLQMAQMTVQQMQHSEGQSS